MSKALYLCSQNEDPPLTEHAAREIVDRILPDNFSPNEPSIAQDGNSLLAVANPVKLLQQEGTSICLGTMFPPDQDWVVPGGELPDGTFALFRDNGDKVEIATDIVGSRTIWYYKDDDLFVASTSQRAIISVLGDFEPNVVAGAWLLSSGSLGPGLSWDRRIGPVPPDGRFVLDKETWTLERQRNECEFRVRTDSKTALSDRLGASLDETFENLDLDFSRWVLPVSGGVDSRYLLYRLADRDPKCVTWGLPENREQRRNDAALADRLTDHYGVEHRFYDLTPLPDAETVLERFVVAGEGRIDHLGGYLDGFRMWADMFERGDVGIVRGDEGFGWLPVLTSQDVRRTVGLLEVADWPNLSELAIPGEERQQLPPCLRQRHCESLETWRDRLYHQFRIPSLLAALNDLKLSYVEIANPFLSREIITTVRTLPDEYRTNKRLYREHVSSIGPNIPEAKYGTGPSTERYLRQEAVVAAMFNTLDTRFARGILSDELVDHVLALADSESSDVDSSGGFQSRLRTFVKGNLPQTIENVLLTWIVNQTIDPNRLAWRAYIVVRMHELLEADASLGT